jgi:hypothetical protein
MHLAAQFEKNALVFRPFIGFQPALNTSPRGRRVADLEAHEPRYGDVLAELGDLGFDQLIDGEWCFL